MKKTKEMVHLKKDLTCTHLEFDLDRSTPARSSVDSEIYSFYFTKHW